MADNKIGVLFKKGSIDELKPLISGNKGTPGTFYLAEDEQNLYFGKSDGSIQRIQGNVKFYLTLQQFRDNETPPFSGDLIYFIADNNAFVRWDDNRKVDGVVDPGWVQLNATADSVNTSINSITLALDALNESVGANAEAIAENKEAIAANAAAIATKGAASDVADLLERMTQAEADIDSNTELANTKADQTALDTANESIGKNAEDILALTGVVNTKAAQSDLTALEGRVTTAEGTIAEHTATLATLATSESVGALKNRMDAAEENISKNSEDIGKVNTALTTYKTSNDARVKSAEDRIGANETAIADLEQDKVEVSVFNALKTRVDTAEENIGNNAENIATNAANIKKNSDAIALKAAQADLEAAVTDIGKLKTRMSTAETDIDNLENDKADKTALESTNEAVAANAEAIAVNAKAITDLDTDLQDQIDSLDRLKATKTALSNVDGRLTTVEGTVAEHGTTLTGLGESLSDLDERKVNKIAGYSLVPDSEIDKLKDVEEGAKNLTVDMALNVDETSDHHVLQTGVVSQEFAKLNKTVSDNYTTLEEAIGELDTKKADKSAVDAKDKELADAIKAINDSIGSEGGSGTSLTSRVASLETLTGSHTTTLGQHETHLTNLDEAIADIEENYATKVNLEEAKTQLNATINEKIEAANAMKYRGIVGPQTNLPDIGFTHADGTKLAVGDTYVVSEAFGSYNAGDLLVAQGTETNGAITGNLTWNHVSTGYSVAFDQTLAIDGDSSNNVAEIQLNSYTGNPGTSVTLQSDNEGLTIVADKETNVITMSLVWGSFNESED